MNKFSGDEVRALVDRFVDLSAAEGRPLRQRQKLYMQRWLDALITKEHDFESGGQRTGIVLSEADTGLGKTMGYLIPMMAFASVTGLKCAVATYAHVLQKQILNGDVARINRWLEACGRPALVVKQRVGRQAFVSVGAIDNLIHDLRNDDASAHGDAIDFLNRLAKWAGSVEVDGAMVPVNSGLIEDAIFDIGDGAGLPYGISPQSICLAGDSPKEDAEAYRLHVAEAERADIELVTHHHLAARALFRDRQNSYSAIVIDESDRLSNAISSMMNFSLSLTRFERLVKKCGMTAVAEKVSKLIHAVNLVDRESENKAVAIIEMRRHEQDWVIEAAKNLLDELSVIRNRKSIGAEAKAISDEIKDAKEFLKKFIRSSSVRDGDDDEVRKGKSLWVSAISFSPSRKLPSLALMPMYPGRMLSRLWTSDMTNVRAVMMTSATLGVPGYRGDVYKAFKSVSNEFGLDIGSGRADLSMNTSREKIASRQEPMYSCWGQYEPEQFGLMSFVLPDPGAPIPVVGVDDDNRAVLDETWMSYAASMILAAAKKKGRTLVLTRSYRDGEALGTLLESLAAEGRLILQTRETGLKQCMKMYVEKDDAIWISPSAWEGIDLPGMVNNLVIFRLPLLSPNPVERALLRGVAGLTESSVDSILFARGVLASKRLFKQGIGRGIRSHDDKCRVWIADPRFPVPLRNRNLRNVDTINICPVQKGYFYESIPERFRAGLTSETHSPEIFWMNRKVAKAA